MEFAVYTGKPFETRKALTAAIKSFALACKDAETAGLTNVTWFGTNIIENAIAKAEYNVTFRIDSSPIEVDYTFPTSSSGLSRQFVYMEGW